MDQMPGLQIYLHGELNWPKINLFALNAITITALAARNILKFLFDDNQYTELFANIISKDFLKFVDLKPYGKRLEETYAKTDIHDSITVAHGKVNSNDLVVACMDFEFIGGSLAV